ncbi:hypothetical protein [Rhodococcus erythropolis]|uniref:hypothetical protein n=1 Tax=Rhodococcus erythropolis TaxID=1833 RepID=UPI00294ABFC3|nr:hypothetical protein [Rhodococcus erythropolis]
MYLSDGQVPRGDALWSAASAGNSISTPASLLLDTYEALRDQSGSPATFPARNMLPGQ